MRICVINPFAGTEHFGRENLESIASPGTEFDMVDIADRYPLTNPVAWTKTYRGTGGAVGRVFFSTTAHPFDFKHESMRKLALNGILWALGRENEIPAAGANAKIVGKYDPNNSGFGDKFKKGLKPKEI